MGWPEATDLNPRSKHIILLFILSENIQLLNIYIFEKVLHGCWLAQSSDIPILRDALYKRGESKLYQEFRTSLPGSPLD